jgi:hypothetical protein
MAPVVPVRARFLPYVQCPPVHGLEVTDFDTEIVIRPSRDPLLADVRLLDYLSALTFDFDHEGRTISAVLIYAQPDPDIPGLYHAVAAQETGYEGVACVDDTARAAVLALGVYEHSGARRALHLARRWLSFVEYMQYPDGSFANFIRNSAGVRNATGATSMRGGYWWSSRALWALARAYRLTGNVDYRDRFDACKLEPLSDGKINGILALAKLELFEAAPSPDLRRSILEHVEAIVGGDDSPYFRDRIGDDELDLWGYHQLHAVATASSVLDLPGLLKSCRRTVRNLLEPDIRAQMWHAYPSKQKDGVTAYDVAPIVQGLSAMYRASGALRYRQLALDAAAWFYGRNDARVPMYDPTTGRCRDGITGGVASNNYGAESAIEAGLAELERRVLLQAA